jgi:mono/diheme cytochrome c family protein
MLASGPLSSGLPPPGAILAAMRRPVLALVVVLAAIGVFTGGLAMLLDTPRPSAGATKGEALYLALCATCHGADGKGSWRAALFLVRPGDLSNSVTMAGRSDKYLFDLIKHGGAPIGRPGMPAFGSTLTDEEIAEVVRYARGLARPR